MTEIVDIVVKAFLAACGAGILTLIVMSCKFVWKKLKADDLTMKALAHDAYFRQTRYILRSDDVYVEEEDLENHNYLYKAYHSQGLNGTGDQMHQQVLQRKVRPSGSEHKDFMSQLP